MTHMSFAYTSLPSGTVLWEEMVLFVAWYCGLFWKIVSSKTHLLFNKVANTPASLWNADLSHLLDKLFRVVVTGPTPLGLKVIKLIYLVYWCLVLWSMYCILVSAQKSTAIFSPS